METQHPIVDGEKMKLVVAEHTHWRSLYRVGCHHLTRQYIRLGHEVLYLSGPINPFNFRYFVTGNPSRTELKYALGTWLAGGEAEPNGPMSYAPMTMVPTWRLLPFSTDWVALNSLRFCRPSIPSVIRKLGFEGADAVLIGQLLFVPLLRKLPGAKRVLRITDDISRFPNAPRSMQRLEMEGLVTADAVVVTSAPLFERISRTRRADVHYIPNGVDFGHYQVGQDQPPEYCCHGGPIAVYMGALDSWFDQALVFSAARRYRHVLFVLIGAPRVDLSALVSEPNVTLLGPRPYRSLPAYLQHADVGIVPFLRTPLVDSVSPLKVYEYLAAGLPVVATRWTELERSGAPVRLADSPEDFTDGVGEALDLSEGDCANGRAFAAANDWSARADQLLQVVTS